MLSVNIINPDRLIWLTIISRISGMNLVLFATAFFSMLGNFDNYKEENILDFFKDLFSNPRQ
jgi:hypothetical protein